MCAVFMLDSTSGDQVAVMRRQLLRLVHCREFGTAAVFKVCSYADGGYRGDISFPDNSMCINTISLGLFGNQV